MPTIDIGKLRKIKVYERDCNSKFQKGKKCTRMKTRKVKNNKGEEVELYVEYVWTDEQANDYNVNNFCSNIMSYVSFSKGVHDYLKKEIKKQADEKGIDKYLLDFADDEDEDF